MDHLLIRLFFFLYGVYSFSHVVSLEGSDHVTLIGLSEVTESPEFHTVNDEIRRWSSLSGDLLVCISRYPKRDPKPSYGRDSCSVK